MSDSTQVSYNFLGKSGLKVSNIAFGTMTFGKDEKSVVCNLCFHFGNGGLRIITKWVRFFILLSWCVCVCVCVWGGGGGRDNGGNCSKGGWVSISDSPFIYLTFEKTDPFIYLNVQNVDLFIYCPLIVYTHLLLVVRQVSELGTGMLGVWGGWGGGRVG